MRNKMRFAGRLLVSAMAVVLVSCATPPKVTTKMAEPVVNPRTQTEYALLWLPKPSEQIPVAVYGVSDETGAFKPSDTVQTLSRAVTQGATPILIKALQDAGDQSWFKVIEREKLDNLLKERQIILEMRQRYLGESARDSLALPALLFAGILIEGAITGYDTNTQTGGAGARYLGIGADTQYREDAVSVYLRAVSVKTGEVLISVSTEQRVASVAWQANAFKYVAYRELLEAEAGITLNQPRHLAVRQALEKAVYGLIIEGVKSGLWSFDDPELGQTALEFYDTNYRTEFPKAALKGVPKELLQDKPAWGDK
nr:CsgG/HfaB family protein [uncultured Hyphomonas sp.]